MKRLIATTALTIALASPAVANTFELALERYADNVDMSMIDDATELTLKNIIYSGGSFSDKQKTIDSILRDNDAYMEEQVTYIMTDSEFEALDTTLDRFGFDEVDPEDLSNSERLSVKAIIYGGGTRSEKMNTIRAIINS